MKNIEFSFATKTFPPKSLLSKVFASVNIILPLNTNRSVITRSLSYITFALRKRNVIFSSQIHSQWARVQKADQIHFRKDVFNMAHTTKIRFLLRKP